MLKLGNLIAEDVNYKTIGADFWELSLNGIEVIFYKSERIKECQKHLSMFKRYKNKGVSLGFTGTPKYSFGLMHKNKYNKLCTDGIIDFWVTETVDSSESNYLAEIKLKTEITISKMQKS
jgi:hypothetical protein